METKEQLLNHLKSIISYKGESLELNISEITASRNLEDKSSAGDKHETGRAMVEIELNNLKLQLSKINHSKMILEKINLNRKTDMAGVGNLIETNLGFYFISIGLGKINLNDQTYFAISSDSPIGAQLMNKMKGDSINFRNNNISIKNIF